MHLKEKIGGANARLSVLLAETRLALDGERDFGPAQIHALREPLTEMDSVMARAKELRVLQPELEDDLDLYKSQLTELQAMLERVRMMLVARQSSLCANHAQLTAVNRWAAALDQTLGQSSGRAR